MIVEIISAYYREEFLSPLYMFHYEWVDRMTVITQKLTSNEFDDEFKSGWVNEAISRSTADWVILVDWDEYIYPLPYGANPRVVLEQELKAGTGVIYSHMTRMWRHVTDNDIDRTKTPVPQRLHGQPDHVKPSIFRPAGCKVGAGNHDITCDHLLAHGKPWGGSHWANADSCFWIERETRDRGPRLSERNRQRGHGTHTLRTREQILAECKAHENDPVIIQLTP